MDTLSVSSEMAHFRVIARILEDSQHRVCGETDFDHTPVYIGLEAMAQLAALHVRHRVQFERHAFLLNVQQCTMPAMDLLIGRFKVEAELISQSSNGFVYSTAARGPRGVEFSGKLLIGTRDYDDVFSKDILKVHYQKRWTELKV